MPPNSRYGLKEAPPIFTNQALRYTTESLEQYGREAVLDWGRHTGSSFVTVAHNDEDWCRWVLQIRPGCIFIQWWSVWSGRVDRSLPCSTEAWLQIVGVLECPPPHAML